MLRIYHYSYSSDSNSFSRKSLVPLLWTLTDHHPQKRDLYHESDASANFHNNQIMLL